MSEAWQLSSPGSLHRWEARDAGRQVSVSQALLPRLQVMEVTPGLASAVRAALEREAKHPGGLGS